MSKLMNAFAICTAIAVVVAGTTATQARDASRASPAYQTPSAAVPNPYAPAPQVGNSGDRAGDAYATGFAIGLGTALINKQREDELKRQREQTPPRR